MIYGYVTKTFLTGGYKLSLYTQPINLNYLSNQAGNTMPMNCFCPSLD